MTRFAVLASLLLGLAGCSACAEVALPPERSAEAGLRLCYIECSVDFVGGGHDYELRTTRGRVLGHFRSIDDAWRAAGLYECPVTIDPTIDP